MRRPVGSSKGTIGTRKIAPIDARSAFGLVGSAKSPVPTPTAVAPASTNSAASSHPKTPPSPMIGITVRMPHFGRKSVKKNEKNA